MWIRPKYGAGLKAKPMYNSASSAWHSITRGPRVCPNIHG